ncbi:unnamed protein product [Eruca vesicaria subsp. sativa]|uniref:Uncharacterized protein n=1 Tax=Eruca vesicaria subsp. sativa TaxID=29727 RepID=A0ABC8LWV4_ERUVS|nr:unnamed protein product [Eruca vesicaria subsp. sativa]
MAKLSCYYLLVLIIVFSVVKAEGKLCEITLIRGIDCIRLSCAKECAERYKGGLGYCSDDPKVPGPLNCDCVYPC